MRPNLHCGLCFLSGNADLFGLQHISEWTEEGLYVSRDTRVHKITLLHASFWMSYSYHKLGIFKSAINFLHNNVTRSKFQNLNSYLGYSQFLRLPPVDLQLNFEKSSWKNQLLDFQIMIFSVFSHRNGQECLFMIYWI